MHLHLQGKQHLSSSGNSAFPIASLLLQRVGAVAFILFFAALRKKRISEGFEHSSLNSSLELRGFTEDYFKRLPVVGGRCWEVLGGQGGRKKVRSPVGEHRGM